MKWCYGVLFSSLLCVSLLSFPCRAQTPEEAVSAVQTALDTADLSLFEQHVDIEALVDNGVSLFLERLAGGESAAVLPPALQLLATALNNPNMRSSLQQILQREVCRFIREGVSSGRFGGRTDTGTAAGIRGTLLASLSQGRKEISHIGTARPDGSGKCISFRVTDYGNGESYPVTAHLEYQMDWFISRINNMPVLLDRLMREAGDGAE